MPAIAGFSTSRIAEALASVACEYRGAPLRLLNAESARLGESRKLLESLSGLEPHGAIVSTDSPSASEPALLLARNIDAVLLVVPLERTRLMHVRELAEQIGKARIVGALSLDSQPAA